MRIEIKTKKPVKDRDIRALYLVDAALKSCSARMIGPTLQFFADRYGFNLTTKNGGK